MIVLHETKKGPIAYRQVQLLARQSKYTTIVSNNFNRVSDVYHVSFPQNPNKIIVAYN